MPRITDGIIDTTKHNTLGLQKTQNVKTVTIFSATDSTDHYANGAVLTAFKGTLYCMWQSSKNDEDAPETRVMYSWSTDEGDSWNTPQQLAPATDDYYCTSGGWLNYGDTLIAFINTWPKGMIPIGGYTQYMKSYDGKTWSQPRSVTMADGSKMEGVIEQDPMRLGNGRIVGAAHFQPGLHLLPIYTDDQSGCTGWHKGQMATHHRGKQSRELEPSLYYRNQDSSLVMIIRDQTSTFLKMASVSDDDGEHWTEPELTNIPDSRMKQSAGNLTDGSAFIAGCPTGAKRRWPLVLLLSKDGITFDQALLLRSSNDLPPRHYPGKAKTYGFSYPKSLVYNNQLFIVYTTNKEQVDCTKSFCSYSQTTSRAVCH